MQLIDAEAVLPPDRIRRAVLYCNSRSRRGREWYPEIRARLASQGFDLIDSAILREPGRIPALVMGAVNGGVPLIIVGGGDGTFGSVANVLRGSTSLLGVLPLGTGNAFARDLGIPVSVEGCCDVLESGVIRAVDLGLVGDRSFVNVATVGITTRIAEFLSVDQKRRLGMLAYAVAVVRAVARIRPFQATLTSEGASRTFETVQVVFGSGRFHAGPFPVTPDAEITDHVLHGYALKATTKGALLRFAVSLGLGRHVRLPEVEAFTFRKASLETRPARRTVFDGEVGPLTPIDVRVDPAAIRVLCSREAGPGGDATLACGS